LARDGVDPPPGLTSSYRALMELWQLDVMGGIWRADGRELKAVTGIDDHSRSVAAGLIERASACSVCRILIQAWSAIPTAHWRPLPDHHRQDRAATLVAISSPPRKPRQRRRQHPHDTARHEAARSLAVGDALPR
jgi:hypothetical protein